MLHLKLNRRELPTSLISTFFAFIRIAHQISGPRNQWRETYFASMQCITATYPDSSIIRVTPTLPYTRLSAMAIADFMILLCSPLKPLNPTKNCVSITRLKRVSRSVNGATAGRETVGDGYSEADRVRHL
jgi:hypothetical protein